MLSTDTSFVIFISAECSMRTMVASESKKKYMRKYNRLPSVKNKKAEYMREARRKKDKTAAAELVKFLLEVGYEDMAFEYAQERAPEMLVEVRASRQHISHR